MDTTRPSLLLRIRDRTDADAWRTFDAIYRPMLYRFARTHGLAPADAEDVTQHCLSVVQDRIGEFAYDASKGSFKAWLRTLARNRVRNLIRDRHDRQCDSRAFEIDQQREPLPDETFDRIWKEEHLWHCMRELRAEVEPATYRAFELYVLGQTPLEEVCRETGLKPNNVYTIKWRMTEKVAAKMKELVDGLE